MSCYHPLEGYRSKIRNNNGKRNIVFNINQGFKDQKVKVPCGQCIGCRLERSRQWAIRCVHEASMYKDNCFITLTYNEENLPENGSLVLKDFQKFMKRLRKRHGKNIRFFHCGEYGDRLGRPHYHCCLFNFDFKDRKYFKIVNGNKYYVSEELEKLWKKGFSMIGEVNFETAAYVARYVMKKVTGKKKIYHYAEIDKETGEIKNQKKEEYVTMSRRPGIGYYWYEKFKRDIYDRDFVIIRGKKMRAPKFYDGKFEIDDEVEFYLLKGKRKLDSRKKESDNTGRRLIEKEFVKNQQIKTLNRRIENENENVYSL